MLPLFEVPGDDGDTTREKQKRAFRLLSRYVKDCDRSAEANRKQENSETLGIPLSQVENLPCGEDAADHLAKFLRTYESTARNAYRYLLRYTRPARRPDPDRKRKYHLTVSSVPPPSF